MTGLPLISIITVSYNSSPFIRETIQSVLTQQYTNFEYLLCDDNSTDDTWEVIQEYRDIRIRAYKNDQNIGEYANRNKAAGLARGEYLIFIDGDDVMYPHALTIFSAYAKAFPECAILIAKDWDYRIKCPYKVEPADFYRFEYFGTSIMGNFTKLFFKTAILQQEVFPTHIKTGDSYMQLKIAQAHSTLIIPDGLTWWRRRSGNATLNLFKNKRYHAESTNYMLGFLNSCPLSEGEVELARTNIYGIFLRLIFWLILKMKFSDIGYLLKEVRVPPKYWWTFFYPRKTGFMAHVTGDEPLHSKPL